MRVLQVGLAEIFSAGQLEAEICPFVVSQSRRMRAAWSIEQKVSFDVNVLRKGPLQRYGFSLFRGSAF